MRLELAHFKFECRLLSVLLSSCLIFNMLDPALLVLHTEASLTATVARLSGIPNCLAYSFILFAVMVVPYVVMQAVDPNTPQRPRIIRVAGWALCMGGVLWIYMAYLSRNLDYATVTGIFVRNGAWNIGMGAVLAFHLNNKKKRECEETCS